MPNGNGNGGCQCLTIGTGWDWHAHLQYLVKMKHTTVEKIFKSACKASKTGETACTNHLDAYHASIEFVDEQGVPVNEPFVWSEVRQQIVWIERDHEIFHVGHKNGEKGKDAASRETVVAAGALAKSRGQNGTRERTSRR